MWEPYDTLLEKVRGVISETFIDVNEDERKNLTNGVMIKNIQRIGEHNPDRNQIIELTLVNTHDKIHILRNKRNIKRRVFIDTSYDPATLHTRRILCLVLQKAKTIPTLQSSSKLVRGNLIIDGKKYGPHNINEVPNEINGFASITRENDKVLVFFSELNPFSNFHYSNFTIDGINFHSSEQYIQYTKVKLFNDSRTAAEILNSKSGISYKKVSRKIINYSHSTWCKEGSHLCEPGLTAKFQQNPVLGKILTSTGDKMLVEGSLDSLWGTGVHINNPSCTDCNTWKSAGILSSILHKIRLLLSKDHH